MAITVVSTQRGYFTDVVKGVNGFDDVNAMQYNVESVTVTSAFTVPTLGVPVVWTGAAWEVYNDANGTAAIDAAIISDDSTLPNKAPIGVIVGNKFGAGFNPADVDFTAGALATVFFRGANNAGVVRSGLDYTAAATSAGNQTAFEVQLEKQGIVVIDNAAVITPSLNA